MGSEGEISKVYVAVGRDVKEGKSLLNWAVKSFDWTCKSLSLLHVHQPTTKFLNGKPSGSKLKNHLVKACLEFERIKMEKVMSQYLVFLSQMEIQADSVRTETRNIEEGILELIIKHNVRRLIMGAKTESFCPKKWSLEDFSKATVIYHDAPPSCHIWFIFKESLVYTRPIDSGCLSTTMNLSSSEDNGGTTITTDIKENVDVNSDNVQRENIHKPVGDPTNPNTDQKSGDVSSLLLKVKSPENLPSSSFDTSLDHDSDEDETSDVGNKIEHVRIDAENVKLPMFGVDQKLRRWRAEIDSLEAVVKVHESKEETSDLSDKLERGTIDAANLKRSAIDIDERFEETSDLSDKLERVTIDAANSKRSAIDIDERFEETSDLSDKLERVTIDAANSKRSAFDIDERLRRWRAEMDALDAVSKAEALYEEERSRNNKLEELLKSQLQEISMMKNQQSQCTEKLQLIKDQKPLLETELKEACYSEKELEEKIIQAVNLLVNFKETRDRLQIEYDSVVRHIDNHRRLQTGNSIGISSIHFFGASFSDIVEATQNFSLSQKIGEGRYGSVFKGTICHAKVAIKLLPSSGSQSDSEDFKHEVELLSRVRHPNLVTLMGACVESRALIYEYIENGSLEDYLSSAKARSLPWQTRIRIVIDICSTILFLHNNPTFGMHGSLKPSKIHLDSNFVTKISGFGIRNLISRNEHPFSCNTPEYYENDEFTPDSDVYSFGLIVLRLLTRRPVGGVVNDVKCAMESGRIDTVLDMSAGEWPYWPAKQLADLALRCCQKDRFERPNLDVEFWQVLEPMSEICDSSQSAPTSSMESRSQKKIPSYFVCPIFQEVMKDPHIAGDGFTYEGDAIKGWFGSGHETSPMTNLKLENCDLLPNYALYYAIQEWQQNT